MPNIILFIKKKLFVRQKNHYRSTSRSRLPLFITSQGKFFSHPGDSLNTNVLDRFKSDVCDPAGCIYELCIQLAIIMIGKQSMNNFLELLYP